MRQLQSNVVPFPAERRAAQTPLGFYTTTEAARISRVPRYMLYAWKREGIIIPRIVTTDDDGREEVGYSFDAVVYLRLLRMLREEGQPLEKAVKALESLNVRFGPPGPNWADVRIFADRGDLFVEGKDEWEVTAATRHGHKVATALFGREFEELRQRADALLVPQRFAAMVTIDPAIKLGHPVIRGTTIETRLPYSLRKSRLSYDQIKRSYPALSQAQIRAAERFEQFLNAEAA